MHRYYQPITPASNKLLKQRWDETYFEEHRRKVATSKAVVDNKPPRTYMHLHLKLKKLQIEEERLATIERDNRILLEKMSQIMRTKGRVDNWNDYNAKSLNRTKRQQELLRVTHENQSILKRVLSQKPVYDHSKWQDDWLEKEGYMESISKYPKEWYKKSGGKRKTPSENTRRSEGRSEQDGGGSKRGSKKDRMSPKEEKDRRSPSNGEERQTRSPRLKEEQENGGGSKRGSKKDRMSPKEEKDGRSPSPGEERQTRSPSLGSKEDGMSPKEDGMSPKEDGMSSKEGGMSSKEDKDERSPSAKEEKEAIVEVDEKVKEGVKEEVKDEVAEEVKEEIKEVAEEIKGEEKEEVKEEVVVENEMTNEEPDEKPEETREHDSKDKIENDVS